VHRNGQRVTDAALVPVILNTYGAVGEKASEFLFVVVGNEAKRIINEISLLAVLQSAEMILQSHAPSNLPNLLSIARSAQLASPPAVEQSDQSKGEDEGKDEGGFLRPDLRGEIQDKKVKCLGCSTESKNVFRIATLWNWNRHVQLVHSEASQQAAEPAAQQDTQPAIEPGVQPVAKRAPKRATQRATAKRVAKRATPPAAPQVVSILESAVRVPAVRVPDTVVCVPCIKDARAPSGFGNESERVSEIRPSEITDPRGSQAGACIIHHFSTPQPELFISAADFSKDKSAPKAQIANFSQKNAKYLMNSTDKSVLN